MTPAEPTPESVDDRSVETAWTQTLQRELPVNFPEHVARRYVHFVFADPRLAMGDPDPETAVDVVEAQLERYRPTEMVGTDVDLDEATWEAIRQTLVEFVEEGVAGLRPGPASAFAGTDADGGETPASTTGAADAETGPGTPTGPETPGGPASVGTPAATEGLASGFPDPEGLTATDLKELIEASDLSARQVRTVLEAVLEEEE